VPRLNSIEVHSGSFDADAAATTVHWRMGDGSVLNLCANLSHSAVELVTTIDGEPLFAVGRIAGNRLEPWTVIWTLSG
jgi:hypothetical protein